MGNNFPCKVLYQKNIKYFNYSVVNSVVSALKFALPTVLGEFGQIDSKDVLNPVLARDSALDEKLL